MKKWLKKATSVAVAAVLGFCSFPMCAAGASAEAGRVSGVWTLDMWHYSGGYWKVGNKGSEQIRIEDRDIVSLDSYLQANQQAVFTVDVTPEIADLISQGTRGTDWQVSFANYRYRDCSMLFRESSPESIALKAGNKIEFSATPVFHFNNSGASLRDYVPGMAVTVPLVDKKWGSNIYSVFGNGRSAVQGLGYYNEDDPSDTGSNAIHPSFITGKSGALEAGHPITLGVEVVDSAGYSIGSGTFAAAGACGLHFEFPVSLVFTDLRAADPGDDPGSGIDPNDPGSGNDPGNGNGQDPGIDPGTGTTPPGDPVDPGDPTDPADPADPSDITGLDAVLELPAASYVGHDVPAKDCSLYEIGGKTVSAARAAELGLGQSSFAIVQKGAGSIRKSGKTGAIAVFDKPGTFQVRLTATAANGLKDTDTGSIEIRKTPYVMADVGGVQKENRKQKLVVTVAQDPRHPVNELVIVLTDRASGESVSVSKVFGGAESAPANSAHIKYRSLFDCGSDAYFLCTELDFLTKWHQTRTFSYEVRAKDSAGNTDVATGTFEVAPDLPPAAAIGLEDVYYRREGGGPAAITADCLSSSDGDALQHTWQYRREGGSWQSVPSMSGYQDLSFGSSKQVKFDQAGVGPFAVRLTVRDLWTEETLSEYVTEADHLSASAEAASRVDNIAPRVSLDLLRTETAEIFVLTESDKASEDVLAAAPGLKAALLAEGIAAEVRSDFRQASAGDATGALTEVTTGGNGAYDYRSSDQQLYSAFFRGMWDGGNAVSDGRYTYMLQPSVQVYAASPEYSVNTYPFTLSAMDADGKTVWRTTVTQAVLDSASYLRDASWGLDADGTYLYLMDGGKTALFDIRTGTWVATLNCTLGAFNLVTPEHIYAFKDSGVWRLPRAGGAMQCVYSAAISCPAFYAGAVHFLVQKDFGSGFGLYRGVFDPSGEQVNCRLLEGSLEGYARDAKGLAIDAAGVLFARSGQNVYCYRLDGTLLKKIALTDSMDNTRAVVPVWSGDGQVRYIAQTGHYRHPKSYSAWCGCYGVYTDDAWRDEKIKEDNYPNYGDPVVYAVQDDVGAVGVYLGCNYVYATGERYLDAVLFSFNGEFRQPMGFPMEEGTQSIRWLTGTANRNATADIKQMVRVAESRDDEQARLKDRNLSYEENYTYYAELNGAQTPQTIATALDRIAAAVKAMKVQGENAAVAKRSANLSRGISLAPSTTYYYEYDTTAETDILSVRAQIAVPDGCQAPGEGHAAEQAHAENFDDTDVNAFFRLDKSAVSGGRYRIGYLRTKESSYMHVQQGTAYPVGFTVPAGYQAVLSVDYEFVSDEAAPLGKYLTLSRDGGSAEQLGIPSLGLSRATGTYVHDSLLEPGAYSLSCSLGNRTKTSGRESSFWLDNLTVTLVKAGQPPETAGWRPLEQTRTVKGDGAMRRVSGSFTTPQQVLHYGAYNCQKVTGLNNAYTALTNATAGWNKSVQLALNVPSGQEVLYAVFTGSGRGGSYKNSSGKVRYYDASWTYDDSLAGVFTEESNGTLALYALSSPVRFTRRNLSGEHVLKGTANTNYGADIRMDGLQLYVTRAGSAVPDAMREGRFFEAGGTLWSEDLVFTGGGQVSLALPEGAAVRNLRIWSEAGGTRVSAMDCSFKHENELNAWSGSGAQIEPFAAEKEEPARVYDKGETIQYQVYYGDYERDPSKKQHWVYTHEPLSDGLWPQAGKDLSAPVTKFYVDGKYTATHWQEDSTGDPAYDKESNRVEITFYINSGPQTEPGNSAPKITSIRTDPGTVKQGNTYTVRAGVDDKDKDPLRVTIELYKDSGSKPIASKTVSDLKPDASGKYPEVVLSGLPKAEAGTYDIVVTVRDAKAADVKSLRFKVKEERSLTGTVTHTSAWEANRLDWNEAKKGTDAVRPANMFWPGEVLVLNAPCTGDPVSVDAQILQFPQYAARLTRGAAGADGKPVFTGQLWHSSMLQTIGTARPVPATVRFTARYSDGTTLTWDAAIIFDQSKGSYYQLHRYY